MAVGSEGTQGWQGPRRPWLVAVLFGVVAAVVIAGTVVLVTRDAGPSDGVGASTGAPTSGEVPGPTAEGEVEEGDAAEGPVVVVLGDSITELAEPLLSVRLEPVWTAIVDGRSGYTVAQQLPAAERLAASDPVQVVVNLGTNDVLRRLDPASSLADLRTMVALYPGARCIHLVTVNQSMRANGVDRSAEAAAFDDGLRALATGDPRLTVVDWEGALRAEEEGGTSRADLVPDTIHPSPEGQELLADLYADALDRCPA